MKMVKAGSLKQGDVIQIEQWSGLWLKVVPTTAAVIDVMFFGSNVNIMAETREGLSEYITEIFAPADKEYELIA